MGRQWGHSWGRGSEDYLRGGEDVDRILEPTSLTPSISMPSRPVHVARSIDAKTGRSFSATTYSSTVRDDPALQLEVRESALLRAGRRPHLLRVQREVDRDDAPLVVEK